MKNSDKETSALGANTTNTLGTMNTEESENRSISGLRGPGGSNDTVAKDKRQRRKDRRRSEREEEHYQKIVASLERMKNVSDPLYPSLAAPQRQTRGWTSPICVNYSSEALF